MKIAILQSNYIPWKGYFDIINMVDVFVLYDEVQYTKNDWRNRNLIKTKQGVQWLTIPCQQNQFDQRIDETYVAKNNWAKKHWNTLLINYSKAPFFNKYKDFFAGVYNNLQTNNLSEINLQFINAINNILEIGTSIISSTDLNAEGDKNERLVDICKKVGATKYLSGPAAKNYLDESLFHSEGIAVEWMDYSNYPQYSQLHPPFEHGVTILDLIFSTGEEAPKYMKSFFHE